MNLLLEATHAILKQPISVVPSQLFTFYYSESQRATILLSIGQTAIPVLESPDEIKMRLSRLQQFNGSGVLHSTHRLSSEAQVQGVSTEGKKEGS